MNLSLYQHLYGISEIPLCLLEGHTPVLTLPELESPVYTPGFLQLCLMDYEIYRKEHSGPLVMLLNPGYYLAIAQLSENECLILGPGNLAQFSWTDLASWIQAPLFKDNRAAMGRLLMGQSPTTAPRFFHTLSMGIFLTTGNLLAPDSFAPSDTTYLQQQVSPSLTQYVFEARESSGFHTPYSLEMRLTHAIETGNVQALKESQLQNPPSGRLGVLSTNAERQMRYMFVTATAVFGRAATRGGLSYEKTCFMEDIYCQRMDSLTNSQDIQQLQSQMLLDFCEEVAKCKNQQYSPMIRDCCTYIGQHAHEKIVLEDLSAVCGLSGRRLSERFRKETGSSITDYIHQVKMEEAEFLLRYSDYTMGEISNYLGYSNQSYFISVFRRFYHETPLQYRERFQ